MAEEQFGEVGACFASAERSLAFGSLDPWLGGLDEDIDQGFSA
jgi:hypothetical protein